MFQQPLYKKLKFSQYAPEVFLGKGVLIICNMKKYMKKYEKNNGVIRILHLPKLFQAIMQKQINIFIQKQSFGGVLSKRCS